MDSLKVHFKTTYTVELECELNGLSWRRFALSECVLVSNEIGACSTTLLLLLIIISSHEARKMTHLKSCQLLVEHVQ